MAKLAWLGLGAMGTPMASLLIEAGHEVTVWNRSRAKAEPFEGRATIAETPADAVRGADAMITMLATPDAVDEVVLGNEGALAGLGDSGTLIDMSTVGLDYVTKLRSRLPESVEFVDAPVLGSVSNAEDGSLKLFIGGTDAAFERWSRVLEPIGKPMHMGPLGSGQAMKLVANSALAGLMSLTGETLALADALGLAAGQRDRRTARVAFGARYETQDRQDREQQLHARASSSSSCSRTCVLPTSTRRNGMSI